MKDEKAVEALQNNLEEQGIDVKDMGDYGSLPESGLMQTRSPYSTAVQVIRPRDLNKVEARCIQEAARAGDEFYYSWSQGGSIIEGNTVGSALMMVRNWGNCAVDVKVQETPNSYVFYGAFIDLETGFNLVRPFKMSKQSPKTKQGRDVYSGERGKDIIFQIGASKAIRNVTLNAVPKWLSEKVLETAKKNIIGQIEKMGKEKAIDKIVKKAEALKIPLDRIEANYGKKESWDLDKVVAVMGAIRSVEDGLESMEEVFADKVALNGEPEIQTKSSKKKKADPLSPEDWENPKKIIEVLEGFDDEEAFISFQKENNDKIKAIGGKDGQLIEAVIQTQKEKFGGK